MSDKQFVGTLAGMGLVTLVVVGAGLWLLATALSTGVLRAWSVSSAALLPVAFFTGWRLGTRDARSFVSGIERGTGAVMNAANQSADLRTANVGRMRAPRAVTARPVALPRPEVVSVGQVVEGEVVDL